MDYNKIITFIIIGILTLSCGTVKPVPIKEEIIYTYRDSCIYNIRDSVKVIPVEKVINVTLPNQSSNLETTLALSEAYTDSLGFLHHTLENKKEFEQKTHTEYIYKYKTDSIYIKEPVPYEVTKEVKTHYQYEKWLWIYSILITLIIGIAIYLKFFLKKVVF